jgi:hypothetical protein
MDYNELGTSAKSRVGFFGLEMAHDAVSPSADVDDKSETRWPRPRRQTVRIAEWKIAAGELRAPNFPTMG